MTIYYDKIIEAYGADPREIPLYSISQAARYLRIPKRTLGQWVRGRKYKIESGEVRLFEPIIILPNTNVPMLSFMNLIEAHVLNGMRRFEGIPFYKVRSALKYIEEEFSSRHPLADKEFETDGIDLFIYHLDLLINVHTRQTVMKEVMRHYLRRIDRDLNLGAVKLYPFLKKEPSFKEPYYDEPKKIMINPFVSFGKPVLVGTGVPTAVIAGRFYAGESFDELAKDYGITPTQIEEAVRYEGYARKAA